MTPTFTEYFQSLTGTTPYPYQEAVAESILSGESIVLRAPTGSGKTWSVVAPYVFMRRFGERKVDRLLYALPLRSLATSLYRDVRNTCERSHLPLTVAIQTGEQRDDPFWEADITFTTIDQLLSGYLFNPLSLPRRVGNINAGALIGSMIVFDEYHLLDPAKSMATSIEMLERLTGESSLAQFALMTATLSSGTTRWLANRLNAKVIELDKAQVAKLASHTDKRRTYRLESEPLTAQHVIQVHNRGRSIVLVNTVRRAQDLYVDLTCDESRGALGVDTKIALLHSRFYPEDRSSVESNLASWFGPKSTAKDVILVTTQVIEAGMDLSSDNLHTEIAPMNSLVQRAGRCARRMGESGTVWIYPLLTNASGRLSLGPYTEQQDIVDQTRNLLMQSLGESGKIVQYHDELDWVDAVHTETELRTLSPLDSLYSHRQAVGLAMDGENRNATGELIRDIDSVSVVITATPEALRFDRAQWPRTLSVPRTSIYSIFSISGDADWKIKSANEKDVSQGGGLEVEWAKIESAKQVGAPWLIAIHTQFACYDATLGLRIGVAAAESPIKYRGRASVQRYQYKYETYVDHVTRVVEAAANDANRYEAGIERLAKIYQVSGEQIEYWVKLTCIWHDVGKLSLKWQDTIWKWQDFKDKANNVSREARVPLAHSDFDPATDWLSQKNFPSRPPHAAEGAYAVMPWLKASTIGVAAPGILAAITRHHGTFVEQLSQFELPTDVATFVRAMLPEETWEGALQLSQQSASSARAFANQLLKFSDSNHRKYWPLYAFLVRRLRLADQAATKEASNAI